MPSKLGPYLLLAVRALLVVVGVAVAAATVHSLATMPPAPPDSDGFVHGMAFFFGSIIVIFALGAAGLGVVLPSVLGTDDRLGFGGGQRALLKTAGGFFAGGFLLGLLFGLVTELQFGLFLWLFAIVLGVILICAAVAWRLLEAAVMIGRRVVAAAG